MSEYLALAWNAADTAQAVSARRLRSIARHGASEWQVVVDAPGMYVLYESNKSHEVDRTYRLFDGSGVVIGRLFERTYAESDECFECSPRSVLLDAHSSSMIRDSGGRYLSERYWGRYVAFLMNLACDTSCVLRDPAGQIPCYGTTVESVYVYFSRCADWVRLIERFPPFCRKYFIGRVTGLGTAAAETAYEGVSIVLPGERIEHSRFGVKNSPFWKAWEIANIDTGVPVKEMQLRTRRVVHASISAWASCLDRLCLQLSGGLDSSVVAACLAAAPSRPEVMAINWHSNRETSDERAFAREIAELHHFRLREKAAGDIAFNLAPQAETTVIPPPIETPAEGWTEVAAWLREHGFFSQFRGDGGDELFHRGGAIPDAVDVAFNRGLTTELWATAWNDAIADHTSVWSVLGAAFRYGITKRDFNWRLRYSNVSASIFPESVKREAVTKRDHVHPLALVEQHCGPAKTVQAISLMPYTMRTTHQTRDILGLEVFQPLISQPHMELSLRTPMHAFRYGGRDRSIVRDAFRQSIPEKIRHRKYKSLSTAPWISCLREVAGPARELLLNGYLVKEGILDRARLERIILTDGVRSQWFSNIIKACLDCEVWFLNAHKRDQDALASGRRDPPQDHELHSNLVAGCPP